MRWNSGQIDVGGGKVIGSGEVLEIQAGAEGKIFVSVAPAQFEFNDYSAVGVEFSEVPARARFFIIWRNGSGQEGMRQFWLPGGKAGAVSVMMPDEVAWDGAADLLGLGIVVPPYATVGIKSISLARPTLIAGMIRRFGNQLRHWSSLKPWVPADVNFYTGTVTSARETFPVQFFATLLATLLAGYLVYLLASRTGRRFNWRVAGALTLACWLALDLLWQLRLGRQVGETYRTFAGKSADEKLLVSADGPIAQFIARVKDSMDGETPRVFLASDNDYGAMLSAYYIAPLNTYWHRDGPELPDRNFLASGDYILLVPPFTTAYEATDSAITLPDGSTVPVQRILQEELGILLRVI